ncbi:VOC family protein [Saccharopolyspora aridisoli]|uniref:VOC family protein n=1 Tax=Saccharopolyspora aridisoli TaxID=2530385 RepID=A0A4R4UDC4_9PSEU|nr:VOC family protein [Saccharopolyspora aridisoli]TDC89531.1 VOC family protein [Saccharopolyspora aridisoli]
MDIALDPTLDCANAVVMAAFCKTALGYVDQPPPAPSKTRAEWLASFGEPEGPEADGAWLRSPDGTGPRLSILRVPEPKTAKNRLHIDIRVPGHRTDVERGARARAGADRLRAAGATALDTADGHHVVMADPEGNEFCVGPGPRP